MGENALKKLVFSKLLAVFSMLGLLVLASCSGEYQEEDAIADANVWLSQRACEKAAGQLSTISSDYTDFGTDGRIAWASVEACRADFFLFDFIANISSSDASNIIGQLATTNVAAFTSDERSTYSRLFDSTGDPNLSDPNDILKAITILQSTAAQPVDWSTAVQTNLMVSSLAAIGKFSGFHGWDGTGTPNTPTASLTAAGAGACPVAYASNAVVPDDTQGVNGSIERSDACMLYVGMSTFQESFVSSLSDDFGGLDPTAYCDLGGGNPIELCDLPIIDYNSCVTDTSTISDNDLYGFVCLLEVLWNS
jgi:hypothetical protein